MLINANNIRFFCCYCPFQMDLQLRNSIYQCNPRCSIEKKNTKTHSAGATAAAAVPSRISRPTDYTASLLDKFERDRTDKHELQRNNYLNETVSVFLKLIYAQFYGLYVLLFVSRDRCH